VQPRQKILVIDDEEVVLDSCLAILDGAGYEMLTATSGEEGLRVAAEASPDNREIIQEIVARRYSAFLNTDFIL